MTDREELFESENFVYPRNEEKYHIASWTGEDYLSEKEQFSLVDDKGRKFVTFPDSLLTLIYKGGNYYEGITEGTTYVYSQNTEIQTVAKSQFYLAFQ